LARTRTAARAPDAPHAAQPQPGRATRHTSGAVATVLFLALSLAGALAGCAGDAPTSRGQVQGARFNADELLQSEGNRLTQAIMQANLASLQLLADKLYRRNPAEWRKSAATREQALQKLAASVQGGQPWLPLDGQRDVAALSTALSPGFTGDRVGAFIAACADTIVTAHGGKREFYYLDGVDPQHVYNAARNMETALWVLNTRQGPGGRPLLLANEIAGDTRNLSFEREFGKIIAQQDMLALIIEDRSNRAISRAIQNAAAFRFLPI